MTFTKMTAVALVLPWFAAAWAEPPAHVWSLDEAVRASLAASPQLAITRYAVDAAAGEQRQADARPNPEVGFDAENIAGSGGYRGADGAEFTARVSQRVELGGKRAARVNVAQGQRAMAQADMMGQGLDLIRETTMAYGGVLAAQDRLRLAQRQEDLAKDIQQLVTKRVSAARDPLIYQNQADVALATAHLTRQQAEREMSLARSKLALLLGDLSGASTLDAAVLQRAQAPAELATYEDRLTQNPDLSRYDALRKSRVAALRLEKAQNVPDPAFSLGVRDLRQTGDQALVAGVSLPIPVWNRNQGGIQRAQAELMQVDSQRQQAELTLRLALQENWQDWQAAYQESTALRNTIIPAAEKAVGLSRQGYDRGRFSFLEVLNAQRTLADAQVQYVRALQRQLDARAKVGRLTAEHLPMLTSPLQDQ